MIPKIIHYCWLSDNPIPQEYQKLIDEWHQMMPDYVIKKWDRKTINIEEHPFAKQAYEQKKYAFAADYIRAYALFTEGGVYLDSDVKIIRTLDVFLGNRYFTSVENTLSKSNYKLLVGRFIDKNGNRLPDMNCFYIGMQAAIIGSEKNHPLIKEILEFYQRQRFVDEKSGMFHQVAPTVHAIFAEKYGFRYKDCIQFLDEGIIVYPSNVFATLNTNEDQNTFAIHCCQGSWVKKDNRIKAFLRRYDFIIDFYMKYKIIRKFNDSNLIK